MRSAAGAILAAWFGVLGALALFGLHRLHLSIISLRARRTPSGGPGALPAVTVQLPVWNEISVLDRLVEAACALRYPRELLEIQILDDSTDGTTGRAMELASAFRNRGLDIRCIHRDRRDGYKAGALAAGLAVARGSLIAVFDADFVPPPEFLERVVPLFEEPGVGMVQARWGHLNRSSSALTRAQALMLDAHFRVEQGARAAAGRFFNFNGTAGVFRRACIEEAGGWQSDTLTEDLDLSYRAQLAGWRFRYLDDLVCPAELPVEVDALRSQQRRWAGGSLQTARKLLPRLMRSPLPAGVRIEAAFHLTNNLAWPLLFAASLLAVPALAAREALHVESAPIELAAFLAGTCSFAFSAAVSQAGSGRSMREVAAEVPLAMALGAGLALGNALAVVEAMAGRRRGFVRTPKHGLAAGGGPRRGERVYRAEGSGLATVELLLAVGFAAAGAWAWREGLYTSVPFLGLFGAGYGYVSILSLAQARPIRG